LIRAIIFDLYDTLIYRDEAVTAATRATIARLFGVPPVEISALWRRYRDERMLGVIPTLEDHLAVVARELGRQLPAEVLADAARLERESLRQSVHLYPHTLRTLAELRRLGFRLGLLSNASDIAQESLATLGLEACFDGLVLSHRVGILKPDPRIYRLACAELQVEPRECAFVADGGFGELDAAHEVGMLAVKIVQRGQSQDYGSSTYFDVCLADVSELLPLAKSWRRAEAEPGG
jgi:putative hydrolase of the HAD superfamily